MTMSDGNPIENYQFLPLAAAVSPPGGTYFQHYVRCWWAVHPERGLVFWNPKGRNGRRRAPGLGSPQCNTSEQISRSVCAKTIAWPVEVRLIESAWVPIRISDYRD
jgi:hypothetical protein